MGRKPVWSKRNLLSLGETKKDHETSVRNVNSEPAVKRHE